MKKTLVLIIIILSCSRVFASDMDADSSALQQVRNPNAADSLKQVLQLSSDNDSLKAPIYTKIAEQYLKYDTISTKKARTAWQNEAIAYTLKAIHYYSRYNDSIGLRVSFDNLAKVYHAQKKYPQAKWFILQSNTLSRAKHDDFNITVSLLELALIKTDIKDYNLAMRDLNEALVIASKHNYARLQSATMQNYAILYGRMKNFPKEAAALKRRNAIDDSIRRDEVARVTAKITRRDSDQQSKKKLYTLTSRKTYKPSSSKKIVSL